VKKAKDGEKGGGHVERGRGEKSSGMHVETN